MTFIELFPLHPRENLPATKRSLVVVPWLTRRVSARPELEALPTVTFITNSFPRAVSASRSEPSAKQHASEDDEDYGEGNIHQGRLPRRKEGV